MTTLVKNTPAFPHWQRIGVKHHHGICLPLFSIRGKKSCGIGEYPDLIPLFSWLKEVGFSVLQLLPLNDPGSQASPYSAISAFALNPLFLGLSHLPHAGNLNGFTALNQLPTISYSLVRSKKMKFLENYYKDHGASVIKTERFLHFVQLNPWLKDYALFKKGDPSYHAFLQFLCFEQMSEVKEKAQKAGILLKGDIPILINKKSADVAAHSQFFFTKLSAGAPPDAFNPKGQNWGFPLYNWKELEKENYGWWRQRLNVSAHFFDLYRLDHIVGFYRIYEKKGCFYPSDECEWIPQGEKILRMLLEASPMLPIGEDLGHVPNSIKLHLNSLGICGTKVIRWEREGQFYIPYRNYTPLSMSTVSTHDTETLIDWWQNQPHESKAFAAFKGWTWEHELSQEHHFEILRDSHQTPSLFHINLLPEYLAQAPEFTWGHDRINQPGVRSKKNWSYRLRPTTDEMINNSQLQQVLKACVC